MNEITHRLAVVAASFASWSTAELATEFALVTDELDGDDPALCAVARAQREALGLALLGRGYSAAELS